MYDGYVGYKLRLYPTNEQKEIFKKYFGMGRKLYNIGLDIYEAYMKYAEVCDDYEYSTLSFVSLNNEVTKLKK